MKAKTVEIIPTKHRIASTNVGQRGLFVHPDVAKIHVEVVGEARYVTAEDDPKPAQTYTTRDMVATTGQSRRDARRAARVAQFQQPTTNTESEPE